jgi:hypothetical protein
MIAAVVEPTAAFLCGAGCAMLEAILQEILKQWLRLEVGTQGLFLMMFLGLSTWFLHYAFKERRRPVYAIPLAALGLGILVWLFSAELGKVPVLKCGLLVLILYASALMSSRHAHR